MRKISSITTATRILFVGIGLLVAVQLSAQPPLYSYVLFAGSGGPSTTAPPGGYGVQIGSSITVSGGSVGSYSMVQTTGNATVNSNIYSGGTISITNSNVIGGRMTAAGTGLPFPSNVISVGSSTNITGNIDAFGSVTVGGGTVNGIVTLPLTPTGATYTGPTPSGSVLYGTPHTNRRHLYRSHAFRPCVIWHP